MTDTVLDRFLRYVVIDTQSDAASPTQPSTEKQKTLGRLLVEDLKAIGLADAHMDAHGYVHATIPSNSSKQVPVICFCSHMDTAPDFTGTNVKPQIVRDYRGGDIALSGDPGQIIRVGDHPALKDQIGNDIVTTDGTTLLGADDKAGMAEIVTAVEHLIARPELPRPTLRLAFTPDEEVGRGAQDFDVAGFGALCAYTVDGSEPGELQDETFTGASVVVHVEGHDVHPGFATGKLVSAVRLAARVLAALPAERTPERTSGREGFVHPIELSGTAARARLELIARDFEEDGLAALVALVRETVERVSADEPRARVRVQVTPQYPNMRDHLAPVPEAVRVAEAAIAAEGLDPVRTSIRGGTDGSHLSALGLPTPNLFTGGHEYHSVREWASVQEMAAAAATLVRLAERWAAPELRGTVRRGA